MNTDTINGREVIASTKFVTRSGMMDARAVIIHDGDGDQYVTALHNRNESCWYWGHYFTLDELDDAMTDHAQRSANLLRAAARDHALQIEAA